MSHLTLAAVGAVFALAALPAAAQEHQHTPGMQHQPGMVMDGAKPAVLPLEGGQAAFAAVGEISNMLQADPRTDWSKVDVEALRGHLIDMDNIMMKARVVTTPVPGGARFDVSGPDQAVRESIQHIVAAHTVMGETDEGRRVVSAPTADGATMTVTGKDEDAQTKVRALGFFGLVTGGTHHQQHHLMMAKGEMRH